MKAIITKYLPFTNHKPSRIKASAEGVSSATYTCNYLDHLKDLDHLTGHQRAAHCFALYHNWSTNLASGGLPSGEWAHCFTTDHNKRDIIQAIAECLPDLEHYAATHGTGPDIRLANLKNLI